MSSFGVACFNADDRAAQLNGGSYAGISQAIRQQVNREFEAFINGKIERGESFAIETTLRSGVTFEQTRKANARGFSVEMRYLALTSFSLHLDRVKARSDAGGHSASETTLRRIYESSLVNLAPAIREMEELWVYDNTNPDASHPLILKSEAGRIVYLCPNPPAWLLAALPGIV